MRVDYNVPMKGQTIVDDNRIASSLPTIKYILEQGGQVLIGAHLGRPQGENAPEFSLWPIANRLAELLALQVRFNEPMPKYKLSGNITLLENLRFDPREEANDRDFAKELADLTLDQDDQIGVFINDAFAVSHRANASVEAITKLLPSFAGLQLQKEIEHLDNLVENPEHPFIVVIGGIKVKDKAGVIDRLVQKADKILLGGGVANTFLKAEGQNVGSSVYDEEMVSKCKEVLRQYSSKIVMPTDFVKETDENGAFKILDIGGQTRTDYANLIKNAKTAFWNGSLGFSEDQRYQGGMMSVAKAMSEVAGTSVIAGGDTVGFVRTHRLDKNITFLSTGGGAAIEYLAGEKLPGLTALE